MFALKQSTRIKKVKRNSTNHREDNIHQQAEEYELLGNITLSRYLRNLITIKQQKKCINISADSHKKTK